MGTDIPFPESGLVPASFLYAFLGIHATPDGLLVKPSLPSHLTFAGVRNLHYRGLMLDVRVTNTSATITCDDPDNTFKIEETFNTGVGHLFVDLGK